jgi:D-alanyl-D-alanine carboxypeptidase
MFTVPPVRDLGGAPAAYSVGLTAFTLPTGEVIWVKTGSRYGYSAAIAASRDDMFRVAFSITSTDAKGDGQTTVSQAIIGAALALR